MKPIPFDESAWQRELNVQSPERLYEAHFKNGKYFNPWITINRGNFWSFMRWRLSKKTVYSDQERTFQARVRPALKDRIKATPKVDFIAWIGHGTFLLRLEGEYWLIDPIFSERALLPKRITPPAINAEQLRELTDKVNVIISHNHYDHLDVDSIRSLPIKSRIFVPEGLKGYIRSFFEGPVQELDWWESVLLDNDIKLVCLPAQHWSRRIGQATNSTLWASYILTTSNTTIYIGGDSGYFIGYREIGNRFPEIRYALLPVTAYEPRWFMHTYHMNPSEAIKAFTELGATYFIPTQWGAFHLGDNPPGKPALDLIKAIERTNLDPSRFLIMDIGQIEIIREPG
ncbi:MAG: MBL fold metallo-hydrolase [Thermodesulfobacteriota bacterium]|nr:MBL fold metallo-hydrolase [Thermodesulfobacteriota bacterium]